MRRIIGIMLRTAAVLFSLALACSAAAQTPDLQVTIEHPPSARLGDLLTLTATVENIGTATSTKVRLSLRIIPGTQCVETIQVGDLAPGEKKTFSCSQELNNSDLYFVEFSAGTDSDPYEPAELRENNYVRNYVPRLTDGTDLGLYIDTIPLAAKPGLPFPIRVQYWNISATPATNAVLVFTLSDGAFGPNLPAGCSAEGNRAVCQLGTLDVLPLSRHEQPRPFTIEAVAPDRSEAAFTLTVELRSDQHDETPANNVASLPLITHRTFYVREATEAALRDALASAGEECDSMRCLVAFRIPNHGAEKWHTIRLESQLDWLRGVNVEIDGTTQAAYFGDTNPDGPEIELDGSATNGDGLRIPSRCGMVVRGFALNGFRESAVLVHDGPHACAQDVPTLVEQNYIGTDPTGTQARPNQRGIFSASAHGVRALRNVVSGNTRSAVYIDRGRSLVANNVIGLNARHDAPLPNGASGVYIAAEGDGTDVNDNYIGFNAHFGVGIDRGAEAVALQGNSFQANGGLAIDWGLDGPAFGGSVPTPVIRGARYANGVTTVEVDVKPRSSFPFVSVYASDAPDPSGFGEGQYYLGSSRFPFRLEVPLDLRGKWISVTHTEVQALFIYVRPQDISRDYRTTTSEMSRAVQVE